MKIFSVCKGQRLSFCSFDPGFVQLPALQHNLLHNATLCNPPRSWYFILFQAPRLAAVYMSHSDFKEVDSMLRKAPRGVIVDGTITDQVGSRFIWIDE